MGLTLHYSAKIKSMDMLPELVSEVEDICYSLKWDYFLYDKTILVPAIHLPLEPVESDPKQIHLLGICINPPEAETVFLTFTPSGRISGPIQLQIADQLSELLPDQIYCIHVKTQFAGEEIHITLVTLLKYLEKKYFSEMEVSDEGNYWNTLDKRILEERFNEYRRLIGSVRGALEKDGWKITK